MRELDVPVHVNPVQAVNLFFKGYFKTRGRASRSEYWWAQLFVVLTITAPIVIGTAMSSAGNTSPLVALLANFSSLWSFAMVVPSLTSASRRLRDTGMSDKKRAVLLTVSTTLTLIFSYAVSYYSLIEFVTLFSMLFFVVLMPFSSLLLVFWTTRRSATEVEEY
jgi:uncharacterized membrane protein YhaH (DUF805 family)